MDQVIMIIMLKNDDVTSTKVLNYCKLLNIKITYMYLHLFGFN